MKKLIYSVFIFSMMLQSCGDQKSETNKTSSTEAAPEEAAEEVVMVDGYQYSGIVDMDAQGAVSVADMNALIE